jgi:ferredoxin
VAHYVKHLPALDDRPFFSFIVHATHRIDTANWLRHTLKRKGGREVGYFHCHGEGHILPLLREGYLFSPDHPSKEELNRAETFGHTVADHVTGKSCTPPPDEPKPAIIYRLERLLASRWLMEHFYSRMFKVDQSKCTACGLCMDGCPTHNITKDALGYPQWDRRCIACLHCEMNCPEEAITSALSRTFPGALIRPWFRYNAQRWAREGELDFVRVMQRHGKTERLDKSAE